MGRPEADERVEVLIGGFELQVVDVGDSLLDRGFVHRILRYLSGRMDERYQ